MISKYIVLPEDLTVEYGVSRWREMVSDARIAHNIYVVDSKGRLKGILTLRELLAANPKSLIKEVVKANFVYAYIGDSTEHIASVSIKNHVCAVPILDNEHKLLGVVSADDILDAVSMESNHCLYRLAGIPFEPKLLGMGLRDILVMVRSRIPWLIICLIIGVFVSGGIIRIFEGALAALPVIVVFIPVLMGSGGNISTQSSTILVRALALEQLKPRSRVLRFLIYDLATGVALGLILGGFIFALALLWIADLMLAVTLFLSTLMLSVTAVGIGFATPYLSYMAKVDPALTSGPIVTLIKDVVGLLIYFVIVMVVYFPYMSM